MVYKTYNDLFRFCHQEKLDYDTKILVPYRESYFGDTELLTLMIHGNGLWAANDKVTDIIIQRRILTVEDINNCTWEAANARATRTASMYERYHGDNKISFSLYRGNTLTTGGAEVKDFVYDKIHNQILLDTIF
jgi:hypothetical protein